MKHFFAKRTYIQSSSCNFPPFASGTINTLHITPYIIHNKRMMEAQQLHSPLDYVFMLGPDLLSGIAVNRTQIRKLPTDNIQSIKVFSPWFGQILKWYPKCIQSLPVITDWGFRFSQSLLNVKTMQAGTLRQRHSRRRGGEWMGVSRC